MTKQSIVSILKNISDDYRDNGGVAMYTMNCNSTKVFATSIKNCGIIYCNGIRIDNTDLLNFYNDGKIIAILDYSVIEKINLL